MRDNPPSRALGWLYIGKWVAYPIAGEVFRGAWALRSRGFRLASALAAFVAACGTLVATCLAVDAAGPRRALAVLILGIVAIIVLGVLYQLAMRTLLRDQIDAVWRRRCARVCIGCGYDIRGLWPESKVCPECGRLLEDVHTSLRSPDTDGPSRH